MTMRTKSAQVVVLPEKSQHPTPRLATAADIRREMADLYRQARAGHVDIADASRLGYLLSQLAQMVRIDDLDQRTAALERALRAQLTKD